MIFSCDLCGFDCKNKTDLLLHFINQHIPKSKFMCETCYYRTNSETKMENHMRLKHPKLATFLKCPKCPQLCYTKNSLDSHLKIKHNCSPRKIVTLTCDFCDKTFARKETIREHLMVYHNLNEPTILCDLCPKRLYTRNQLRKHQRQSHTVENVKCKFEGCNKLFKAVHRMERHYISHSKEKRFKCEYCTAEYGLSKNLKMHREIVHLGYKYFCVYPGCNLEFLYKRDIVLHLRKRHATNSDKMEELMKRLKEQQPHIVEPKSMLPANQD